MLTADGEVDEVQNGSRKNGVACTIARVIRIKNVFRRGVAVNVRTELLLMVEIAKNMKSML